MDIHNHTTLLNSTIKYHSISLIWQYPSRVAAHYLVILPPSLLQHNMLPQASADFIPPPLRLAPCHCFVQQVRKSSTRQHANQTGSLQVTRNMKNTDAR